ncbi:bifunctional metallophosphatase/5'-nucleotidase [Bifidobacterium breve]|uniref:5'-nucleotidase, C-terminal domain protein n=1 Tax=Bifidobacterium breve DSM 20213 = JCM 1192 TaxID=518634 RepID=D4BRH1_BIFBR|nr:5'-nucleotidase C-terminal domain-containing protein [Bifidobacterium breve]AYZ89318.1 bifunctional metallophosphatase/5'-nucleotidase [Bifidobacterium breve]EFE88816.1 5'-nucleotidase, C-terminal domain protein [Bifidobacterium breve DSM 20213 = JCM 1192]KAB1934328.1 bifunctional metallophosphatase/5'-nucleotidase [Bifidobacterium breve]MDQ4435396.1 5'-nucleotidase C-terminal domain-containing protein [Bifidobacterium breve]MED7618499.1 bifunctional metallophosphatase/5'-nucleotidase [Bifi
MKKRRRRAGGRPGVAIGTALCVVLTALVAPNIAGAAGAVPFSGEDPATGTRTVTIADITDFHGHIEHGADVAAAFTLADSHNPDNMVPVSTGDLVGGSPYESAVRQDKPTLDMAKVWGLTVSAVGNHEFDRSVADFNNRVAAPANGIDWLCANVSSANKSATGKLSHVKDYTIRTVNGKRIGFVGALTDALGSVATPQITEDADLSERAVDALNRVAGELKRSGKVDAVVALLHADASAATGLGRDVDLAYTGHTHAVKQGVTDGGAPIYEAGSFGQNMAVQDLIITGHGRHAKVQVADVNLGNGTEATAVPGVLNVEGLDAHPRQAAWMSAGVVSNGSVARSRQLDTKANYAARAGNAVIGTLAPGTNFDKRTSVGHEGSVGMLVADANRESIMRNVYAGTRLPVVGFSNDGSLRTKQLDMDEDGKVTIREVDSLMALQFHAAHETLTGLGLKAVLAQQFHRNDDGELEHRWLGISSNVRYRYVQCGDGGATCTLGDSDGNGNQHTGVKATVGIVDLTIDGRPIADDDLVIIASNSYLLQGGDNYSAFRAGSNYGELEMSYNQPLHEYLAAHPKLSAAVPETGTRA